VTWLRAERGSVLGRVEKLSRPVLGATQLHIQWVPRALSLGIERPRREADRPHPPSV
jgi:hypothetical protein